MTSDGFKNNSAGAADVAAWDQGANIYADISEADPFKEELDDPAFLDLLGNVNGIRILDLGCGDGILCRKLKALGAITTGIDSSPQMLQRALAADPGGDYRNADISGDSLPLKPGMHDIVTAKMSLMCVNNLEAVAHNAKQALVKEGLFAADIVYPTQLLLAKLSGQKTMYGLPSDYTYEREARGDITFGEATFPYYSRSISDYINRITGVGFALCRMEEIVIDSEFAQQHPKYAGAARQPISMHLLFQS